MCAPVSFWADRCCWQAADEALAAILMVRHTHGLRGNMQAAVLLFLKRLLLFVFVLGLDVCVPEVGHMSWGGAERLIAGSSETLTASHLHTLA